MKPGSPTFSAAGLDGPGSYVVGLRVTDAYGRTDTVMTTIQIINVAPTAIISGSSSSTQGQTYTLSLSATDPGPDVITSWLINWGDGTTSTVVVSGSSGSAASSASHAYVAGSFSITSHVVDEDGTYATNSIGVSVAPPPPVADAGSHYSVNEGAWLTLSASGSTGTGLTYAWDLDGDGIYGETGGAAGRGAETGLSPVFSAAGLDGPGTFVVGLRVTDLLGRISTTSTTITINNVAPTLTVSGAPTGTQGADYTLSFSSSDPGIDTITNWTINWGDGTTSGIAVSNGVASATHQYSAGIWTISSGAADEDGSYTITPMQVNIAHGAPTADAGSGYAVAEGGSVTLSGAGSTGDGLTYLWDLDGDGVFGETGAAAGRGDEMGVSPTFSAAGLDGPSVVSVGLKVVDSDGQISVTTASINVTNVAPTIVISGAVAGSDGTPYTLNFAATDPGPDSITSWVVNWGDGTTSTINVTGIAGSASTSTTHVYHAGLWTITSTAQDEDGTYQSNSLGIGVASVFFGDSQPPSASGVVALGTVVSGNRGVYDFNVNYSDNQGLDVQSVSGKVVEVDGARWIQPTRKTPSLNWNGDHTNCTAAYEITSPTAGAWTYESNGSYTIHLKSNAVKDTSGNVAKGKTLGSFIIAVPVPDSAGDTKSTARNLGVISASTGEALSRHHRRHRSDWYRFQFKSLLILSAAAVRFDGGFELRSASDANNALIKTSGNSGTHYELISRTLAAGVYYCAYGVGGEFSRLLASCRRRPSAGGLPKPMPKAATTTASLFSTKSVASSHVGVAAAVL